MVLIEIIANFVARLITGAAQLFFAPLYIALLGVEAYGLIGFYLTLLGTLLCLDQAISPVVTRSFATAQGEGNEPAMRQAWRTFRTLERLSLGLGITLGVALFLAAPWAARNFLHTSALSRDTVETALVLMAGILIAQWPSFVYAGALAGLCKQVSLNLIRSAGVLLQFTVGVGIVYWAGADITGLFFWVCSSMNPFSKSGHVVLWAVLTETLFAMMALALLLRFPRQLIRQFVISKLIRKPL